MAATHDVGPILNGIPTGLPDIDPDETREWVESLAGLVDSAGRDRARYVMLRLLESATDPDGVVRPFHGDTAIFITPGYRFRAADVLMTNFHLPKSTLFMLVSAFAGLETMKAAYAHAVETGYRFYSYGDGSLLFRA